jgi:hypothetical protein
MSMKKYLACLLAIMLLSFSLAACGDSNMDNTIIASPSPSAAHTATPSASPYISPDVDNGIVNDDDGIIDDNDTGVTASTAPTAGTENMY